MIDRGQTVRNWLRNGGLIGGVQPYLFCDSTWLEMHFMSDNALDYTGNPVNSETGHRVLIDNVPIYRAIQSLKALENGVLPMQIFPVSK